MITNPAGEQKGMNSPRQCQDGALTAQKSTSRRHTAAMTLRLSVIVRRAWLCRTNGPGLARRLVGEQSHQRVNHDQVAGDMDTDPAGAFLMDPMA